MAEAQLDMSELDAQIASAREAAESGEESKERYSILGKATSDEHKWRLVGKHISFIEAARKVADGRKIILQEREAELLAQLQQIQSQLDQQHEKFDRDTAWDRSQLHLWLQDDPDIRGTRKKSFDVGSVTIGRKTQTRAARWEIPIHIVAERWPHLLSGYRKRDVDNLLTVNEKQTLDEKTGEVFESGTTVLVADTGERLGVPAVPPFSCEQTYIELDNRIFELGRSEINAGTRDEAGEDPDGD